MDEGMTIMTVDQCWDAQWWDALSAISTCAAAVAALFALKMAKQTLGEAKLARKVTLSITLSERFSSDEMHDALAHLGRLRDQYHNDIRAMCDAYVAEVKSAATRGEISEWDRSRRKVSKFFIAAHALCKSELLEPEVFSEQIQRASIDLYVQVVAPLNEAQAVRVQGRKDYYDRRTRDYFFDFLVRHHGGAP
jgi:hypothetical protein